MTEKSGYTAVPLEDPQVPSERELPPYSEKPRYTGTFNIHHECCYQHHQRRKTWRKALFALLVLFIGGKVLFAGLSYFMFNDLDDKFIRYPELEIGSPEYPYNAPPVPSPPESPVCDPTIKWNGPSELLLDPRDVTGLVFNVKGVSAFGSVTIRQDTQSKDLSFVNITNKIYLSEDSLQREVDIKIDIIDDDYTITIEAPSFDGPRPTQKCVKVNTIITIPSNINFFRSLVVDVPNSSIYADKLGSIDFAYVNFKTRNGHIRANSINAAIAEMTTVNGHIQGRYVIAESLDTRTINGGIGINALISPWAEEVSISTKSINGHLCVAVDELIESQVLNLKAGSINGGVVATVPDTYQGDFSVSTMIGYSYVEGQDITYIKNTKNVKTGFKNKKDDDEDDEDDLYKKKKMHKKCRHGYKGHKAHKSRKGRKGPDDDKESSIIIEAVTGTAELYYL